MRNWMGLQQLMAKLNMKSPSPKLAKLLDHAKTIRDGEALSMLEGVLQVSQMRASDIMVPRSQMITLEKTQQLETILATAMESHHSRFPVYNHDLDNIEGILLAKDLLIYLLNHNQAFDLQVWLRPAMFIPESKRLNVLLHEFRSSKNHMAIVVDEYGDVAGLVTIEDILEQIVGEIDDEHDIKDKEKAIKQQDKHTYIVNAILPIDTFNHYFSPPLADHNCDTIGGLVTKHFGHVPQRKESIEIGPYTFTVVQANARRIDALQIKIN